MGEGSLPALSVDSITDSVVLRLKMMLSSSARASRRASTSPAARGTVTPISVGAKVVIAVFSSVAMAMRWLLMTGTAQVVAFEADICTVLHQY